MVKILLNGCLGKMGQAVEACVNSREDVMIIAGVDIAEGDRTYPVHTCFVDVAEDGKGDKCFLLAAGGNPGQDIEVLNNDAHKNGDPWYYLSEIKDEVKTPEFSFKSRSLYHLHSEDASGDASE